MLSMCVSDQRLTEYDNVQGQLIGMFRTAPLHMYVTSLTVVNTVNQQPLVTKKVADQYLKSLRAIDNIHPTKSNAYRY